MRKSDVNEFCALNYPGRHGGGCLQLELGAGGFPVRPIRSRLRHALDEYWPDASRSAYPAAQHARGLALPVSRDGRSVCWKRYFQSRAAGRGISIQTLPSSRRKPRGAPELCIAANFVEVTLAREGHANPVGINYLERSASASAFAIRRDAGWVPDHVLMGAGIPLKVPGVHRSSSSEHQPAVYDPLHVTGSEAHRRRSDAVVRAAGLHGTGVCRRYRARISSLSSPRMP